MSTGSPHYLRFFVAAVFSGTLIVGDLHFSALDDVRTRLSLVLVPIRTAAELPGTMRDGTIAYLRSREALLNEKAALEAQIAEEDAHLKSLEFIRQQNSELRQLLGIRQSAPGRWLAAEVVRNVSQAGAQRVLLNRGLGDGVVLGQAVVDEAGVVGQVVRADVNTSVVGLLTAPGQWISTRVVRNNLLVLLRGDSSRRLAVEYVTNDADLREGDVLLRTGGVFPPGYPVAVVDSLEDGAQFKQGGARPLFDFSDNAFALLYLPAAADNATGAGEGGSNVPFPAAGQLQTRTPVLLVFITLFLSLAVEFAPLPAFIAPVKPLFPLLAVVYWAVHQPRVVDYGAAVLIGIIIDLADQAPLGFNAMSFAVAVLFVNILRNRFILLVGVPEAIHVFIVLAAAQLCLYFLGFLEDAASQPPLEWMLFLPSISAAMLWLLLPAFMRYLRRTIFGTRHDYHAGY